MPRDHRHNDRDLLARAEELLNQRSYKEAEQLLNVRIGKGLQVKSPSDVMLIAEIVGFLIDIGSEGHREEPIKTALALFETNREHLCNLMTPASIEYNLGNAKSALADIRTPDHHTTPGFASHDLLLSAKNHYWAALKASASADDPAYELRTNLGVTLRKSGRIVEALATFDEIADSGEGERNSGMKPNSIPG